MSLKEIWTKNFAKSLTKDEQKAFKLWLDFSEGKICEKEFKEKMDMKVMPRVLGKMSAARINALEYEVENLRKKVNILEKKMREVKR